MDRGEEVERLKAAATAEFEVANYAKMERIMLELLQLCSAIGDKRELAETYRRLGTARNQQGKEEAGEADWQTALTLFQELGDRSGIATTQTNLGTFALESRLDVAEARRLFDLCVPTLREPGNERSLAYALANLGKVCRMEGDYDTAMAYAKESYDIFTALGNTAHAAWQLVNMAHYYSLRREYAQAMAILCEAYEPLRGVSGELCRSAYFEVWFIIATEVNEWDVAARLIAFLEKLRAEDRVRQPLGILPWLSPRRELLTRRIPEERFHLLYDEGEKLTVAQAQAMVESIRTRAAV